MAKRRVLVLIKGLGIGGAEKLISEGARYWDRSSYDYHVAYVLPWKDQLVAEIQDLGIPVRCVGGAKGSMRVAAINLRRLVAELQPDLIHVHSPAVAVIARLLGVPVVYTEHNVADSYRSPTAQLNRLTYRRNARVIAVSDRVAESLAEYAGPDPVVVTNGVSVSVAPEDAAAARAELGLEAGVRLIVHVGNIRPHKGHTTLIAAAAKLDPATVQVVSIGGEKYDGDLDRVRREAAEAGADGVVRFLGRRSDALAFVAAADMFVNPADVEGLPVAVLEAMALEKPIVATAVGGVPSIIKDRETGLLVPPKDPAAIAHGITELISNPELGAQLAAAARSLVEAEFGLERMVRQNEREYQEALGG